MNPFERSGFSRLLILALIALNAFFPRQILATEISNVQVGEITGESAVVTWTTDVASDGLVNYGLDPNFGMVRYPNFDRTSHSLKLEDLEPSRTYYFRVGSTDAEGNSDNTAGFVFTTGNLKSSASTASIASSEQKAIAETAISAINKLTDPAALAAVADALKAQASDVLKPPTILGATKVVTYADRAEISWSTDRETGTLVKLVSEDEYVEGSDESYTITQGDPNERATKHFVEVIGLRPSTVYHFKAVSVDDYGLSSETSDDTFATKALLPVITNVTVSRIQETSATIKWQTPGVLTKGVVEFTNTRNKVTRSAGNAVFATSHSVQLSNLEFGTRYSAKIISVNESGDQVEGTPFTFITVRDVVPPEITRVKNESTLFPSEEVKIQTIISWETDEPSYCQVSYSQGAAGAALDEASTPRELDPLTSHTQVIVGFAPATVYRFWMVCEDEARNENRSEDFVLITPVKEKSIIDIILENFEGTFGWVKNVGG